MENSSSALTLISRAFSSASCLMNATWTAARCQPRCSGCRSRVQAPSSSSRPPPHRQTLVCWTCLKVMELIGTTVIGERGEGGGPAELRCLSCAVQRALPRSLRLACDAGSLLKRRSELEPVRGNDRPLAEARAFYPLNEPSTRCCVVLSKTKRSAADARTMQCNQSSIQNLKTPVVLLMPSNTHVASKGTYWPVISLMASCATMPPRRAAICGRSTPPARALHAEISGDP